MCKISLYILFVLLLTHKTLGKDQFKGQVYKNPFRIRRLVEFEVALCKDIEHLKQSHQGTLLRYGIKIDRRILKYVV